MKWYNRKSCKVLKFVIEIVTFANSMGVKVIIGVDDNENLKNIDGKDVRSFTIFIF